MVSKKGDGAEVLTGPATVEVLYERHFAPLVAYLRARFRALPSDPEDVAQRAFANLVARGDLSDVENPQAYLWRTAKNIAVSDNRAAAVRSWDDDTKQVFIPQESDDFTPERVLVAKERLSIVNEVLKTMPMQRRRAFVLHRVMGLNYSQVSRKMGIGRTAVTKHVARATADIEAALEEKGAS